MISSQEIVVRHSMFRAHSGILPKCEQGAQSRFLLITVQFLFSGAHFFSLLHPKSATVGMPRPTARCNRAESVVRSNLLSFNIDAVSASDVSPARSIHPGERRDMVPVVTLSLDDPRSITECPLSANSETIRANFSGGNSFSFADAPGATAMGDLFSMEVRRGGRLSGDLTNGPEAEELGVCPSRGSIRREKQRVSYVFSS